MLFQIQGFVLTRYFIVVDTVLQCVVACCNVLQYVAMCYSVLQCCLDKVFCLC